MLDLLRRLVRRDEVRSEAEVQADVRQLLLSAPLQLEDNDLEIVSLESPVGDRRRIDVEVGSAVIEVKRDLRKGRTKGAAIEQLAGYVSSRAEQTGRRYLGILTDGAEWRCYDLRDSALVEVTAVTVSEGQAELDRLLFWIEGVLATARGVSPTAAEIAERLGAGSSAHKLDRSTVAALFNLNKGQPSVRMKRGLWSKLLTSTLGTQFEDSDELFIEHTLLVNSAQIIAHAVLGIDVETVTPEGLLSGEKFEQSGIYGVVEQDFFGWVLEVPGGGQFIRALARRLSRFDWAAVNQDVLKVLYESVIGAETRKRLGEYYTPDWLARLVVDQTVGTPLSTRVLDPACGSGTFLFHTIRKFIVAAEEEGQSATDTLQGVTHNVIGMDLHPVAVTFARVTYLLAIGHRLLTDPTRGQVSIPVYLGDSMQWTDQSTNLWNAGSLVVPVNDQAELFTAELRFPDRLLQDAAMFDSLVEGMADAASRRQVGDRIPSLSPLFQRLGVPSEVQQTIEATFKTMCSLHDQGRDHIWSYYVRNLARPLWLSRPANRVDALVGNPPWLAYRHMPPDMQAAFRTMSIERRMWHGAENATHQDLSALFVARAVQLYLRQNGQFGMVMPNAVVDRDHYSGFRTGNLDDGRGETRVSFESSWDFRRVRPHFFPRGSSVVYGRRADAAGRMPDEVTIFSGSLPRRRSGLSDVAEFLARQPGQITVTAETESPYRDRFRQGAILAPRLFFFVERKSLGPLGGAAGLVPVSSSRSVNEKKPWKSLSDIEGVVEAQFLRPMYSGENLLPYRTAAPLLTVIPQDARRLLKTDDEIAVFPGLADWWRKCEQLWNENRSSERLTLIEQLDYMSKLSAQFPVPAIRVVYNSSGMHLAAAILEDPKGVINNKLYWCAVSSFDEAHYLCAILNSPVTTEFVRPLMSYGKDERDVHKHVWKLPFPEFDPSKPNLLRLSELGRVAGKIASTVHIEPELHFAASRRSIRNALVGNPETDEIDQLVYELLS